ncbi:MAG: hypothetical protein AMJ88_13670 [Anaerolineae bacterium SM23_ 63]|nr:MAG: hypothetical protein AMJ88_13670 [Anaerolineae bacterium SM23_ 63]
MSCSPPSLYLPPCPPCPPPLPPPLPPPAGFVEPTGLPLAQAFVPFPIDLTSLLLNFCLLISNLDNLIDFDDLGGLEISSDYDMLACLHLLFYSSFAHGSI